MDLDTFLREGTPRWQKLESAIERREALPPKPARPSEIWELVALYRRASADLLWARRRAPSVEILDYLNGLVARGYSAIYAGAPRPGGRIARRIARFYRHEFPCAFRRHLAPIGAAAAIFLAGALSGYSVARFDPAARFSLIPAEHQLATPGERVREDESSRPRREMTADRAAAFSAFLFTHNIQVSLLSFALGLTFGLGTILALLVNGAMLGALAADYQMAGESVFFWSWILPHGVLEIPSIVIASGAGFLLARALFRSSLERPRREWLRRAGVESLPLLFGCATLLVAAGLIEGSISQIHGALLPEPVKLAFSAVLFALLLAYLFFTGSADSSLRDSATEERPPAPLPPTRPPEPRAAEAARS